MKIVKELKFTVVSCVGQKLWICVMHLNMPKYAYLGVSHVPIAFDQYVIERWILALYLCFHGLRTQKATEMLFDA